MYRLVSSAALRAASSIYGPISSIRLEDVHQGNFLASYCCLGGRLVKPTSNPEEAGRHHDRTTKSDRDATLHSNPEHALVSPEAM